MSTTADQDTAPAPAADELLAAGRWTGKIYSDGWVDGASTIDSIEPATGDTLASTGVGDAGTVARAATSAAAAQREWAQTPITERVAVVRRAAEAARAPPGRDREMDRARVGLDPAEGRRRGHAPRSGSSTWPARWSRTRSGSCSRH